MKTTIRFIKQFKFGSNTGIIVAICCALACGCASPRTMVILIPDRDGQVGMAHVTTDGGRQLLDGDGQAAIIMSRHQSPEKIVKVRDTRIKKLFGEALAAEPLAPKKFNLYFKHGTTALDSGSIPLLSEILSVIHQRQCRDISINGHTDRVGSHIYNQKLSLQRALNIKKLLIKAGIDSAWITTDYHGEGNPLIYTADNVKEPRNRRVELVIR